MKMLLFAEFIFFAQSRGGAYFVGQIVGMAFMVILVGAVIWKLLKK